MKVIRPEQFRAPPACVLIDFDNTLYAYPPCHAAGIAAVHSVVVDVLGLSIAEFDRCFSDARTEIKARLAGTGASHNRVLYFQRALERAGLATRPFEALQLEQAYWRAYLDAVQLFPHAVDFLDDLRLSDIPLVVVTDLVADIQLRKLVALGLDAHIDWLVSSEESGHEKPHPASFELALAKLGGIEGPIWMIGDNHDCDLVGAKEAVGAITLHIVHDGVAADRSASSASDAVFSDFKDLRRLLAGLLSA
jgi:putative hydrolase of the HAD superfamily